MSSHNWVIVSKMLPFRTSAETNSKVSRLGLLPTVNHDISSDHDFATKDTRGDLDPLVASLSPSQSAIVTSNPLKKPFSKLVNQKQPSSTRSQTPECTLLKPTSSSSSSNLPSPNPLLDRGVPGSKCTPPRNCAKQLATFMDENAYCISQKGCAGSYSSSLAEDGLFPLLRSV